MYLCKIPDIIKDLSVENLFRDDLTVNWPGDVQRLRTHLQQVQSCLGDKQRVWSRIRC